MRALEGQRIVVTRAIHQAEELARPLREMGAEVILLPTIGIAPPLDPRPLRTAAMHCNAYDWVIFTSANAVDAFARELSPPLLCTARIATIGSATREAAQQKGFTVALTPAKFVAESLVNVFHSQPLIGLRILIPSAAVTRDVIAPELRKRGAEVTLVEAYRNVVPSDTQQQAQSVFRTPPPDWVTFTSSSAVENLIQVVGVATLQDVKVATIGPVTSDTVRHHGLHVSSEAAVHTVEGVIAALCGEHCPK